MVVDKELPRHVLPRTVRLSPRTAPLLAERLLIDPNVTRPIAERVLPKRTNCLTDTALPMTLEANALKLEPMKALDDKVSEAPAETPPNAETPEPK